MLVTALVVKAQGVILWVRLVVDEIIEGPTDGETLEELQQLLSGLPEELEDLYSRPICRVRRGSALALARNRFEVDVVFKIVLFAQEPFTLYDTLAAARYLTTRRPVEDDLSSLSYEQMENRLNRMSSGLLEATNTSRSNRPRAADVIKVQFIHQTVKDFMITENGGRLIRENIGDNLVESGNILILRYIVAQLGFIQGEFGSRCDDSQKFALDNFYNYAQAVGLCEDICAATYIEKLVERQFFGARYLGRILEHDYEAKWLSTFEDYNSHSMVQKLLF